MQHVAELPVAIECSNGRLLHVRVAHDATVAELESTVRTALNSKQLSLIVDGCTPAAATSLRDLHDTCKRADGFLYVTAQAERSMGYAVCTPCCSWSTSGGEFNSDLV